MQPLVSVIIPAYNAEQTIRRAIDSALNQGYPELEIIVIDDGSKDETAAVVRSINRSEICFLQLEKNVGECGAMNAGIAKAKGAYIAFLDADDAWRPTKLAKQIGVLEQNPAASFASCLCEFVYNEPNLNRTFGAPPPGFQKGEAWRQLLRRTFVAKPCVVARASCLKAVGPFDTDQVVAGDQDMWLRLATLGELEIVEEVLTTVFETDGSLTKVHGNREAIYVVPMIARHLKAHASQLTWNEWRQIWAVRYTNIGRNLYGQGEFLRGARYLLQAMALGGDVLKNARYLIFAAPPIQPLKEASRRTLKRLGVVG